MNPWRPYPLIRLVAAFIAGILSAIMHISECRADTWVLIAFLAGVVILATFPAFLSSYRLRWIRGLVIFSTLVLYGNQYALGSLPEYFTNKRDSIVTREGIYAAIADGQPAVKAKSVRITAALFRYDSTDASLHFFGRVLVYFKKDDRSQKLAQGDALMLSGKPVLLPGPSAPGSFDMRDYYSRQGISFQVYVPSEKWRFLSGPGGFSLLRTAGEVRARLLRILQENNVTGEEFAVSAALLLGYVSEIDRELLSDYSSSGAMHILSVSGMHVGVIYLFIEFILGLFERRRQTGSVVSWIKAALMLACIWSYAVLTGLSPPVRRAAIMLGMVIVGKSMKRQPDILNILAASLFVILLSDPFLVLDVGCQFSYLAVAGIVLLYKPVYDLYVTSRWFPDKIWSLGAVSIAAQIATFPLGLYVFHQFPNYFLLTNLLAVPLSSLIIYTGILLLITGSVPWLGPLTGKMLSLMVWLLNQVVRMIDSLPGSVTKGIFFSLPEMFLVYVMITCLFLFFLKKRKLWFFLFLVSAILFTTSKLKERTLHAGRSELVIYHGKTTNIDFISGDRHFLLMQDPLRPPDDYMKSNLANHWASKGITHHFSGYLKPDMGDTAVQYIPDFLTRHGNYLFFCGKRVIVLNKRLFGKSEKPLETDVLVVCNGVRMKNEEMKKWFNAGMVIMSGKQGYTVVPLK
jgi:competence protein ComEC